MPTFVLKKYEEKKDTDQTEEGTESTQPQSDTGKNPIKKEMSVEVSGSISEIIANALNKVFVNTDVEVEEVKDGERAPDAEAITMEDIRSEPLKTLRAVKQSKVVVISGEGFYTKEDEWFITNMEDYPGKVFYSVEKFVDYLVEEFKDTDGQ